MQLKRDHALLPDLDANRHAPAPSHSRSRIFQLAGSAVADTGNELSNMALYPNNGKGALMFAEKLEVLWEGRVGLLLRELARTVSDFGIAGHRDAGLGFDYNAAERDKLEDSLMQKQGNRRMPFTPKRGSTRRIR